MRPKDLSLLDGRPLLDLGTGDAQTLAALASSAAGPVVGVDRSLAVLLGARRTGLSWLVGAEATALPFTDCSFGTVLAADLFHHLDDDRLGRAVEEVARVMRREGRLVAWWYETAPHAAPDAPAHPRELEVVVAAADAAGYTAIDALELDVVLPGGPKTIGLTAVRQR